MSDPKTPSQPVCVACQRADSEVPLLTLTYQGGKFYICPEHLPILIHHPQELIGRLPGVENLSPHQH
ncbi:MAG TPA: hypothetical protein PKG95_12090 [Anaerolineaceae bacterium]|jgi:hypothetical protein|nr:hypothetical protein [Anaerolineaceae bacterium]